MGKSSIRKNLICAAVAASALAGVAVPASAAQWTGTWDPVYFSQYQVGSPPFGTTLTPFGSPFVDPARSDSSFLYFKGSATFDTGSCGNTPGTYTFNASPCTGWSITNIKLTVGEVTLPNIVWSLVPGETLVYQGLALPGTVYNQQTFNFTNATGPDIKTMVIDGSGNLSKVAATFHPGEVQQASGSSFLTGINDPFTAIVDNVFPFISVGFSFSGSGVSYATLGWRAPSVTLDMGACTGSSTNLARLECGAQDAFVTFTPAIPEPSTYALMGLGLAAVAVTRRRATRKASQA